MVVNKTVLTGLNALFCKNVSSFFINFAIIGPFEKINGITKQAMQTLSEYSMFLSYKIFISKIIYYIQWFQNEDDEEVLFNLTIVSLRLTMKNCFALF